MAKEAENKRYTMNDLMKMNMRELETLKMVMQERLAKEQRVKEQICGNILSLQNMIEKVCS